MNRKPSGKWKKIMKYDVAMLPREGWKGLWDAFVAVITGKQRYLEEKKVEFSVYVKHKEGVEVELNIWNPQVETGKKE